MFFDTPPWWWIALFILLMLPMTPFIVLNIMTARAILPLDRFVELYVKHVVERILL